MKLQRILTFSKKNFKSREEDVELLGIEKILSQKLDIQEFNKLIKDNEDIFNKNLAAVIELKLGDKQFPAAIITAFPEERENKDGPLRESNIKYDLCKFTIKYHMLLEEYKKNK